MHKLLVILVLLSLTINHLTIVTAQDKYDQAKLFSKDEITIVITDSGLGGLSVMDDISKKMKGSGCFRKVNLIFVNALFDASTGYNALKTREEKIRIFSNVLTGIEKTYQPDIILIACNTLSVIYKETDFLRRSKTPVLGIVDPGVKLISEKLLSDNTCNVIIFGTETTIEEGSHIKALDGLNSSGKRIITKACPQLQSYIEQNPASEETGMLISVYLNEALDQLPENHGAIYLSLNCSHFGYSSALWEKALRDTPDKFGGILDPNTIMGDFLGAEKYRNRFPDTKISYRVTSKVKLLNEKAIFDIFHKDSPGLADALQAYVLIPDLFE
jgi:glutamate racemase